MFTVKTNPERETHSICYTTKQQVNMTKKFHYRSSTCTIIRTKEVKSDETGFKRYNIEEYTSFVTSGR